MIEQNDSALIRRRITFHGWVQGVGFRWRAAHAAERYGCTGWVKNEYDGSVTMEIQGTQAAIDSVIISIEAGRFVTIEKMWVENLRLEEDEYWFSVR